jgi:streptogramin lyase
VAEERARRLAVLDPADPCMSQENPCDLAPLSSIDLPAAPHNLTAHGSVVFATHPRAGAISRIDIATGEVTTVVVGVEPHDVKYSTADSLLYVTDEEGRRLLTLDPKTLDTVGVKDLPARPHDLAIAGDAIWITMIGTDELGKITGGNLELFPTGKRPHDLIVDTGGLVWFSNWGSAELSVFDPTDRTTVRAPAGVVEPHHFAIGPAGEIWVSDNGGSAIVRFGTPPTSVDVGPVPHHLAVTGHIAVVAVSGLGQAVFVRNGEIVGIATLTRGLHGVAIVHLQVPPPA